MLPSLVIKKEYRRTLQQDVVPASCPPLVPGFQPAGREIDAVMSPTSGEYRVDLPKAHSRSRLYSPPVSGTPATTKTPIPNSLAAFLPGTGQYVECDVTHSKQTSEKFLPGARTGGWRTLRRGTRVNPCTIETSGVANLFCGLCRKGSGFDFALQSFVSPPFAQLHSRNVDAFATTK